MRALYRRLIYLPAEPVLRNIAAEVYLDACIARPLFDVISPANAFVREPWFTFFREAANGVFEATKRMFASQGPLEHASNSPVSDFVGEIGHELKSVARGDLLDWHVAIRGIGADGGIAVDVLSGLFPRRFPRFPAAQVCFD